MKIDELNPIKETNVNLLSYYYSNELFRKI